MTNTDRAIATPIFLEAENELMKLLKTSKKNPISTGFCALDQITSGFQRGEVTILGARPGMGKTSFATQMAWYASSFQKQVSVFFSLGMDKKKLMHKVCSNLAQINSKKFVSGEFSADDAVAYQNVRYEIYKNKSLFFDDQESTSVLDILAKCQMIKRQNNGVLDLVVIDYLQLIMPSKAKKSLTRKAEVAELSRSIKMMSRSLDCAVVLLSQLNRGLESRQNKRPLMNDIRESGSIEQDADVVMFLYRDEYYNKESFDKGICEIIVSKNRNGETGSVKLGYAPEYNKFSNL